MRACWHRSPTLPLRWVGAVPVPRRQRVRGIPPGPIHPLTLSPSHPLTPSAARAHAPLCAGFVLYRNLYPQAKGERDPAGFLSPSHPLTLTPSHHLTLTPTHPLTLGARSMRARAAKDHQSPGSEMHHKCRYGDQGNHVRSPTSRSGSHGDSMARGGVGMDPSRTTKATHGNYGCVEMTKYRVYGVKVPNQSGHLEIFETNIYANIYNRSAAILAKKVFGNQPPANPVERLLFKRICYRKTPRSGKRDI